jgi:hypothetical protein
MLRFSTIIVSAIILIIGGCSFDAPHDNPLDPKSQGYTGTGSISGKVVLLNFPAIGIASVYLYTIPSTLEVISDSSGFFQFPANPAGEYTIIAAKDLYSPDTVHIVIDTGERLTVNFFMNASPEVNTTKILTRKIDRWWPNPAYSAVITAVVSDPNGVTDIDSVWLRIDSLRFLMTYSVDTRAFQLSVNSYELPSNNIEWLVGKPLTVVARDQMKSHGTSTPFFVSRVIEQEATPDFPKFRDTTTGSPVFRWTPPDVRFLYSYTLSVVRVEAGTQSVIWKQDNIENYLLSYPYPSTLEKGDYFWTIAVVDEYGNYSQSKESSFVVY